MTNIVSSILVLFGSIVKFSMGTLATLGANLGLTGALANVTGGIIGIVLFTYLGGFFQAYLIKRFPSYFSRKFTPTARFLVKIKQRFGLGGVAAVSPLLLSIPVGVLFALSLTRDKKEIMLSMILSLLFWSTVIFLPYFIFDVNIVQFAVKMVE